MSDYEPKCKKTLPIIFDDRMPVNNLTPKLVGRVNDNTEDLKNLYEETGTMQGDIDSLQDDVDGKLNVPETAGTAGQVLTSDGEGGAVWAEVGAGEIVVDPTLTVEGAAADAKKTGDEITHLKQDINEFTSDTKNIFTSEWSDSGYGLDLDTGAEKTQTGWRRTGFVPVSASATYTASCALSEVPGVYLFYYDTNRNFISRYDTPYGAYPKTFTTPANTAYVRVLHTSGAKPEYYQIELGTTATSYSARIIPNLEYTSAVESVPSKNLNGEWVNGGINYDTGADSSDNYVRTDYIEVEPNKTYAFNIAEVSEAYSCYAFYYTETKTFVSRITTPYGWFPKVLTVPNDNTIKYVRLLMQKSPNVVNVSNGQAEENEMSTTYRPSADRQIPWIYLPNTVRNARGKKIVVFGDSITAIGDVPSTANSGWTSYFKASVEPSEWHNYAVGGSTFCDYNSGDFLSEQIDTFLSASISDVDCFIIATGTNDTNVTIPSDAEIEEQFYDASMNPISRDNVDKKTWTGAFRYAVENLVNNTRQAKIFVCTPLSRTYSSSEPVRSLYGSVKNKCEIIKKLCYREGIECIDTHECGITQGAYYLADGLHTKPIGARVQANYILSRYMASFNHE